MKNTILNLNKVNILLIIIACLFACKEDDPQKEDTPELITKATLTFTPSSGGGNVVVATAVDPDGEGVQSIAVNGPINLATNKTYVLTISLINELASPNDAEYNISKEVEDEGDEHIFFFSWMSGAFSNPSGNGNVDNRNDPVNYAGGTNSKDINNRALGLTTTWTTGANASLGGTFRVMLKHQPGAKTETSDATVGETDLDITFALNVQ